MWKKIKKGPLQDIERTIRPLLPKFENKSKAEHSEQNITNTSANVDVNDVNNNAAENFHDYFLKLMDNYSISGNQSDYYLFYNEEEQDEELNLFVKQLNTDLFAIAKNPEQQEIKAKPIKNIKYVIFIATQKSLARYVNGSEISEALDADDSLNVYLDQYNGMIIKANSNQTSVVPVLFNGTLQESLPFVLQTVPVINFTDFPKGDHLKCNNVMPGVYHQTLLKILHAIGWIGNDKIDEINDKLSLLSEAFKQGKSKNDLLEIAQPTVQKQPERIAACRM